VSGTACDDKAGAGGGRLAPPCGKRTRCTRARAAARCSGMRLLGMHRLLGAGRGANRCRWEAARLWNESSDASQQAHARRGWHWHGRGFVCGALTEGWAGVRPGIHHPCGDGLRACRSTDLSPLTSLGLARAVPRPADADAHSSRPVRLLLTRRREQCLRAPSGWSHRCAGGALVGDCYQRPWQHALLRETTVTLPGRLWLVPRHR
jgi:hypothetical protein